MAKTPPEPHPPYDEQAEQWVLGSIMMEPGALLKVEGVLRAEDFHFARHGLIYDACRALSDRFESVDPVTVAHELEQSGNLDAVGGRGGLAALVTDTYTTAFVADYAEIIRERALQRDLIAAAGKIAKLGYEGGEGAALLGQAQELLLRLADRAGGKGPRRLRDVEAAHREEIEAFLEAPEVPRGLQTDLGDIDRALGGLEAGCFYVLAARTSMGKSAVALSIALNVARKGVGSVLYSLEMTELAILFRAVFAEAKLDRYVIRAGRAARTWRQDFLDGMGKITELPVWLDDTPDLTIQEVRTRTAQLRAKEPKLGLVIFDYGELAADTDGASEQERVSTITRRLQAMAKGLSLPVLGVYQLSRQTERRAGNVPQLSDLRMSGMIEQAADAVILLYRPSYYLAQEGKPIPTGEENLLYAIIAKQRDGKTGRFKMFFDPKTGRVGDWEKYRYQ